MKNPLFSIIIPAYNRLCFLKIALKSVLAQTFPDYELLVVDDGSKENIEKIIKQFKDNRIKYIYQKHAGVSRARNKGIGEAKGKFICFLDSDDRFRTQKLEVISAYIKKFPRYRIFHTEEIWYRNGGYLPQKIYHKKPTGFVFENALRRCCISISTAAIKKTVFAAVGRFDESLPACEDYDFWLRATAQMPVILIPQYLTIKEGGHRDQQSKKYPAMDKFRIYALAKILKSGLLKNNQNKLALQELKNKCAIYIKGAVKRKKDKEINYYEGLIKTLEKKYV